MQSGQPSFYKDTFPELSIDDWFQFPPFEDDDDGVIAFGGNLSPGMLLSAYLQGIFPWYSEGQRPIWWSPNPRFVLLPSELHVPSRLERTLKAKSFHYTMNKSFSSVIQNCALAKREGQDGTWILDEVIEGYKELHRLGFAHSFEAWHTNKNGTTTLAGGFYGVLLGQVFCGESMFSHLPDASKCAFVDFVQKFTLCGGGLIDSQVYTDHIARFGAKNISRDAFLRLEKELLHKNLSGSLKDYYI